jgi:hypothetical protein
MLSVKWALILMLCSGCKLLIHKDGIGDEGKNVDDNEKDD